MGYSGYVKKKEGKEYTAVEWIQQHPEDIPIARENLAARDRGFANDDVRQLMAAICLTACIDFKFALRPNVITTKYGQRTIEECRKFFGEEMFQFFVNGMSVKEIEAAIRRTPEDAITSLWKNIEKSQASKAELKKDQPAKNTTPIIEEQCDEQGSLTFA